MARRVNFGLPRMRGDRPVIQVEKMPDGVFTPHARGSTTSPKFSFSYVCVYPACAGIDLSIFGWRPFAGCLPRMRGDRPASAERLALNMSFTPHARGSTFVCCLAEIEPLVYPACAGIDRRDIFI